MRRPDTGVARSKPVTFRMTERECMQLEKQAADRGMNGVSSYIRFLVREDMGPAAVARKRREKRNGE